MRVVIADDAALVRAGLAAMLADGGIEVVAEATDAESLLQTVDLHGPDAAVVDIRMPPTHTDEGIVAAGRLRQLHPHMGVLVMSQALDSSYAMRLLEENPASVGYLLKERIAEVATLVDSLRRVMAGECVVDPVIVSRLLSKARHRGPLDTLTSREREVLALISEGRSNAGIGQALFLSERTVETHVSRVFDKLGLHDEPSSGNRRVLAVLTYLREGSAHEGKP
jgi:DNA-binding NarL/FixJ family response regulator